MTEERLLTIRDVSIILGISEKEVIDLAEGGRIPAYKIGGVYLRFKRHQVEEFRKEHHAEFAKPKEHGPKHPLKERIGDFLYFNDFYILALLIIAAMLVIIFQGY